MSSDDGVLDAIRAIAANQPNLRRLQAQLRTPLKVIPFVGAGLSMPFGFPGWTKFLLSQAQAAGITELVQQHIQAGEYEEAAEELQQALDLRAFNDAIEDAFGDYQLEGKELQGAVSWLPQLATGPVITTNFDRVLERVFLQADSKFEQNVWGAKADIFVKALQEDRRFLLKIHGDWEDSTGRILTRSEFQEHYGGSDASKIDPSRALPSVLKQMLSSRRLLFLGCSLAQDRTVDILKNVVKELSNVLHYAIVEEPVSEGELRKRSRHLSEHGIRPVWYPPGRHDLIEPLLAYLVKPISPQGNLGARRQPPSSGAGVATSDGQAQSWRPSPDVTHQTPPVTPYFGNVTPATIWQSGDILDLASRGSNHRLMRRYGDALEDLNQVIMLNPNDAWAIADRADVYRLTGRPDAAPADFDSAIRPEPNDAWVLDARGETYRPLHLYRQALDDLNQAIQLEPNDAWAIACRGETYRLMHYYYQALGDLDLAIKLQPNDAWAIACRGETHRLLHFYDDALKDLDLAIGLQPNDAWAIACRGETYRLMQDYGMALEDLNLAIDLQPDSAWAFACRALTHLGINHNSDALSDSARAVELEPDNDELTGWLRDRFRLSS